MKQVHNDIALFMNSARQNTPNAPFIPPQSVREFRARFAVEECLEHLAGLGVDLAYDMGNSVVKINEAQIILRPAAMPASLVEIADSVFDQVYVGVGTAIACGIYMPAIWAIGQANNMAKFAEGHYFRDDGKLMKPPGHKPPTEQFLNELIRQNEVAE